MDTESLGESLLLGGINLGDGEWWVVLGEGLSGSGVLWGKLLAVSTIPKLGVM